jgi:serine/threonine-protein kinase
LAKLLEEESGATRSGVIVGTPSDMAPEQARGESRTVGPAADVYALGAILYELLTGRPPFTGDTALSTLMQVMGSEPVSPRRLKPELHRDLDAICLKCLEKSPERRFASAAELADALERHLKGEDVPSARVTPGQALSRWVRRNPALASRIAILAVCALVLAANTALGGSFHYSQTYASLNLAHLALIFAAWLGLSWLFQRLIRRNIGLTIIPYIWAACDVAILTTTLLLTDSLVSPIDIGFPLLIAAAGLWLRPALVWFTLACTILGHGGATVIMYAHGYDQQLHRHVIFLAGLVTMAFLVSYQVQRFRALSRYYEGRG